MEHIRIDEGIRRIRKRDTKPSDIERKARNEAGQFLTRYTPELRALAIEDSKIALESGARVDDIADKHGIPRSTLYSWLIGEESAGRLRTQFFDGQCARTLTEIRASTSPLDLTRADRELNGWLKVAAVRDSKNYGPKQEITHNVVPVFAVNLASAPQHPAIDGESVVVPPQITPVSVSEC